MKKLISNPSFRLIRKRSAIALAAACLLGLPLVANAKDHNNFSWQSVSGFLSDLGNNIANRGRRAVEPDSSYQDHQSRDRYDDRRYLRNNSMEAAVQKSLTRTGYYNGPIDGIIGPMSRRAIANYQADRGFRVTG